MARFISADGGTWVNLDYCATVEELHHRDKPVAWLFRNSAGETIARLSNARDDFETVAATIWPAAANAVALVVWTYCDATPNGRPDTVRSQLQPIAGWRLTYGAPQPVLLEEADGNTRVLIALPDGRYLEQVGATYTDVADAEAHVLADDQAFWDDRQRGKAGKQ